MTLDEYEYVKYFTYDDYVGYLHKKYGVPKGRYKRTKSLTKDGLYIHHVKENEIAGLSDIKIMKQYPNTYQRDNNLVYCDLVEHTLLHLMIKEQVSLLTPEQVKKGYGFDWNIGKLTGIFRNKKADAVDKINQIKDNDNYIIYNKLLRRSKGFEDINRFYIKSDRLDMNKYYVNIYIDLQAA